MPRSVLIGAFLSPRNNTPDGKHQLNEVQQSPAVKALPEIESQPAGIAESPQIKAPDILPNIQRRSRQTYEGNNPGEPQIHDNSPFRHSCANLGFRKKKRSMIAAGLTVSRYDVSSFKLPS